MTADACQHEPNRCLHSINDVRAPHRAEINGQIAAHPAYTDLKAAIDRYLRSIYRGAELAERIDSYDPETYLAFSCLNRAPKIEGLQKRIAVDLGLPTRFSIFRGTHICWHSIAFARNQAGKA